MNYRKVYGGRLLESRSMCDTCVYARLIKGHAESEQITICDRWFEPMRVPFQVRECSDYEDRRLPDVEEMKEIAWMLVSKNRPGHEIGFISAKEFQELQDEDEDQS